MCTAIAATALVMLSAATMVHAATGGDGTGHGAWAAIIPDAFQFDRHAAGRASACGSGRYCGDADDGADNDNDKDADGGAAR